MKTANLTSLAMGYRSQVIGRSLILQADCFEWLSRVPENSIHAIVTDMPYSDGVGIQRDAATAKPQFFITGDVWFTYNLLINARIV